MCPCNTIILNSLLKVVSGSSQGASYHLSNPIWLRDGLFAGLSVSSYFFEGPPALCNELHYKIWMALVLLAFCRTMKIWSFLIVLDKVLSLLSLEKKKQCVLLWFVILLLYLLGFNLILLLLKYAITNYVGHTYKSCKWINLTVGFVSRNVDI